MQANTCLNKRIFLFLIIFLASTFAVFPQKAKGLILDDKEDVVHGKTRALIVGISKYEYVDTLQYADRDAKMFADYLGQNRFWGIEKDDITLLLNNKAKYGDLTVQLQRIATISKPGDNLLFYFSGHGDVETQTIFNRGYLLAYDTYSSNYMANGLRVDDLKDLFVTLLSNNIKVIIVTDACRSGKLAGGLKGAEFTAAAISNMWKNEIKILSSQPGQLSYEDKKWGNGRGVFSYYLINGLNGEADLNKDSIITLSELEMYVGNNVARETGDKQQPIFEGPNKFSSIIVRLQSNLKKPNLKPAGNNFLHAVKKIRLPGDSCDYIYEKMNIAISEKIFESKTHQSATILYQKLKACSKDTAFILQANSLLLAALMNSTQEIVNNSFVGKKMVSEEKFKEAIGFINLALTNNDLRLPFEKHLSNLRRYLQVLGTTLWGNETLLPSLEPILDSALKEEPEASYLLSAKGILELRKMNYTKAIQILEKATALTPGWLIPKYYLGVGYGHKKNYRKALDFYEEVLQKDTLYRTFECVKCIQEKIAEYTTRLKRINYDKYLGDVTEIASLDSLRNLLSNNIDSADFYYTMGKRFDKKNHPHQDSVYFFYSQSVELDPEEPRYIFTFLKYLRKESYGEMEIREMITSKLDNYYDEDKNMLLHELLLSYLGTKEIEKAFTIFRSLKEDDVYRCSDIKRIKKYFNKIPEFQSYLLECQHK